MRMVFNESFVLRSAPSKNTSNQRLVSSLFETTSNNVFYKNNKTRISKNATSWSFFIWYLQKKVNTANFNKTEQQISNVVFKDLLSTSSAWRHIKGYPVNGQRTWSNANSASNNNKLLLNFRLTQFSSLFGKKKANFTSLLHAEYINRLWKKNWPAEWLQAKRFLKRSMNVQKKKLKLKTRKTILVDINSASKNLTTGYKRKGAAAKLNKSKKAVKTITIGLPIFYSRYIYLPIYNRKFPYKVDILYPKAFKKHTKKK